MKTYRIEYRNNFHLLKKFHMSYTIKIWAEPIIKKNHPLYIDFILFLNKSTAHTCEDAYKRRIKIMQTKIL